MSEVVRLKLIASDEEILQVVRDWCARLAVEDYAGALSMVRHDGEWTPEMFRDLISTYAGWHELQEGEVGCKVTPLDTAGYAPGDNPKSEQFPRHEVSRQSGHQRFIGHVWFDLPLDGVWSDLTATFDVCKEDGRIVLELVDVHVM